MPEGWRTRLTLQPGQAGTRQLVEKYGDRLVCVRYRYDAARRKRYKTVELIEEEAAWLPPDALPAAEALVGVVIGKTESSLQQRIREAGGRWNTTRGVWELRYADVVALGLTGRLADGGI
ncbi:MAG TPA: hypothetical protein PKH77_24570 [Anaerolineae bacterium]|nr:hypothetical protein [Anaerolineae bacterium]